MSTLTKVTLHGVISGILVMGMGIWSALFITSKGYPFMAIFIGITAALGVYGLCFADINRRLYKWKVE